MRRIILLYGVLAGGIIIAIIAAGIAFETGTAASSVWLGYLVMLAAFSLIFAGMKRYRDIELGGVIRFPTAAGVGVGIALVSCAIYVLGWETYLWISDYRFFPEYAKTVIEAKRAGGASAAEIATLTREMAEMGESYTRPLYRMAITSLEILPLGLLVSLISAALLRNTGFLPHRSKVTR